MGHIPKWIIATPVAIAGAAGLALAAISIHGGLANHGTTASSLPYPENIRIPIDRIGGDVSLVDTSAVPVGSIISQHEGETAAAQATPGTIVFGSVLVTEPKTDPNGKVSSPTLYWLVSVDPPGGCPFASDGGFGAPPSTQRPEEPNVCDIFVDAATGKYGGEVKLLDPSLSPLPIVAPPSPTPGGGIPIQTP